LVAGVDVTAVDAAAVGAAAAVDAATVCVVAAGASLVLLFLCYL